MQDSIIFVNEMNEMDLKKNVVFLLEINKILICIKFNI